MKSNFGEVTVEVVECPDLQETPFHLACKGDIIFRCVFSLQQLIIVSTVFSLSLGLNGSTTLCEIGSPVYLLPLVDRTKLYDLREISQKLIKSSEEIFSIGAGAGYHPFLNENCEVCFSQSVFIEISF